ncbi:glycosyltransferase [Hufsiella ginkgonis]|uniref:Glycosyltransferase n=1 Tax=Hufsiella ginkgonis TaxID=2695274 RepID=A0A7K1Y2L2_9SPHI|nr:glycosyltransferase [Hufsiella ginkgonis]MXV17452.1 hypothetical protein [Hufsiella ginkgonis]
MLKLLSFQPFSLYANGGGNRILRRLYQGKEQYVTSLAVHASFVKPGKGPVNEILVDAVPIARTWARWKLRSLLTWLRNHAFKRYTISRIRQAAAAIEYDVLHVVNHGLFSAALCTPAFYEGKQLWVSFHDHYIEIRSPFEDTQLLWNKADRRLVISEALGRKYQQIFGNKPYEIITDGVMSGEIRPPLPVITNPVTIYFAGLLHMTYLPLFAVLADALDALTAEGNSFKLVLRGTQDLPFINNRAFEVDYRPVTLDNTVLKEELDTSAILYLPIKFTSPEFYLYSLSTKMVGYLAAPGAILYHGPGDSAACKLLEASPCGVCCHTLDSGELSGSIRKLLRQGTLVSANAKALALERFGFENIQQRFWHHEV